jgi:hypothetical protein
MLVAAKSTERQEGPRSRLAALAIIMAMSRTSDDSNSAGVLSAGSRRTSSAKKTPVD